ncbi:hypothetical protein PQX77_001484 [Marasmius sp. AFHP31]|nr:hypothetical protein PQX77_001484 [Marasmius sp. AFHP31]
MISTATASLTVKPSVGRYVPVHRRGSSAGNDNWRARDSSSSNSSNASSSPPSSPMKTSFPLAFASHGHTGGVASPQPAAPALPIYSINDLLLLQKSPFARMTQETRDEIKERLPEIVLSRKQRHTLKGKMHGRIPNGGQGYARPPQLPQQRHVHDVAQAPAIERVPVVHVAPPVSPPVPSPPTLRRQTSRMRMARRGTKSFVDDLGWRMVQRSPVVA